MKKKILIVCLLGVAAAALAGCGNAAGESRAAGADVKKAEPGVSEERKDELEQLHLKQAESIDTVKEVPAGSNKGKKVLIAYFTWGGRSEEVAQLIQGKTGGDLFSIRRETPYPTAYQPVLKEAAREVDENALPKLAENVPDIQDYDVIILGYPAWWFTAPRIVVSFLTENRDQLKGKLIVPYMCSYSSPFNVTLPAIHDAAPEARFFTGLTLDKDTDYSAIDPWLAKAGF